MKLKKLLKYIVGNTDIRIWYADTPWEKYKMWEGHMFDIPKKFKEYQLVKTENTFDAGAIFPMERDKIRVTVVKEQ